MTERKQSLLQDVQTSVYSDVSQRPPIELLWTRRNYEVVDQLFEQEAEHADELSDDSQEKVPVSNAVEEIKQIER